MEKELLMSIDRSLRVILALLLKRKVAEDLTLREQIAVLNGLGLKPKEISAVLGRSSVYVSKELTGLRKSKVRKGK